MCVRARSDLFKNVFLMLNLYFFLTFTLEINENVSFVNTSPEDETNKYEQEFPLDLSIRQNNNSHSKLFSNSSNPTSFSIISTDIDNQSEKMMSDFFINSSFFETNEYENCQHRLDITYRRLKFFFTKQNIYNFAAADLEKNVDKGYFTFTYQIFMETKYLILNIKNDIIETMTNIYPSSQMGIYNTEHLESINNIEIYQDHWINTIKMSPIHIKQDFNTSLILEEFIRISYDNFEGSSFCISTNKLSRYINANFKHFL